MVSWGKRWGKRTYFRGRVAEPHSYLPTLSRNNRKGDLPRQACLLSVASAFLRNLARKMRDSGVRKAMT